MTYDQADEVIKNLFELLLRRIAFHETELETSMKGSDFIFDSVNLLYYKCYKTNLNRGGSYIDSPDWIKNKKATMNPVNNDDKYFHYAAIVALNHEETVRNRISKIKLFINKYNSKGINYSSGKDDWKMSEKNNVTIALNVLHVKKIKYISCLNFKTQLKK